MKLRKANTQKEVDKANGRPGKCCICKSKEKLQWHHIIYGEDYKKHIQFNFLRAGSISILIQLCEPCHNNLHKTNDVKKELDFFYK